MTLQQMQEVMTKVFNECDALRGAGQKEYANSVDAFDNFNRLAAELKLDRKAILTVYARKHWDGIVSFINGHKSQRESVTGRINDMIVYMCLLRGMIEEESDRDRNNPELKRARDMANSIPKRLLDDK